MAKVRVGMGKDCIIIDKPEMTGGDREYLVLTIPEFRQMMSELTELIVRHVKEVR